VRNLFTESALKNERRVVTSTEEKRGPVRKRQDAGRDGIHCSAIAQGLPSAVASEDRISAAIDPWLTIAASEMPPVILLFRLAFLEIGSAVKVLRRRLCALLPHGRELSVGAART
jgi:hypothetical protein